MDSLVYNSLGTKINRTLSNNRESGLFTLKDFLNHKMVIKDEAELKRVFIRDLKDILNNENIFQLISEFFEIEAQLQQAIEMLEIDKTILNFDEFYRNLSPILMRVLLETEAKKNDPKQILKALQEAIRISLEEELAEIEIQDAEKGL